MITAEKWIDMQENLLIEDICTLVRIPSVSEKTENVEMPFGKNCLEAIKKACEISERMGFQSYNHENYCASMLWKGEWEAEIGIFGHADVVPAGTGWSGDPFCPVVKDGIIIGRGTSDNKGSFLAALYAVWYLKEAGWKPKHSIRFWFGCNEEAGMEDIEYYAAHYKEPVFSLVPDVNFPVCNGEKGVLELDMSRILISRVLKGFESGIMSNAVPADASAELKTSEDEAEKLSQNGAVVERMESGMYKVSVKGIAAHAAFPENSESAEVKLAKLLLDCEVLDPEGCALMEMITKCFSDYYGAGLGVPYEDALSGKLTHVGGIARYDGTVFRQNINIRYNVTAEYDIMIEAIRARAAQFGFVLDQIRDSKPCFTDPESPVIKALLNSCNSHLKMQLAPFVMGGGTYARKLKHAVGFGPGIPNKEKRFGDERGGAHQPDEYVEIAHLKQAFLIYADALQKIDQLDF